MTNPTFDRWLLGAGGLIALLACAAVLTFENTRRLNEDAWWVAHTHEVMDAIEAVGGRLREAEAAQRTYLITGEEPNQAEFQASFAAARQAAADVKALTDDNRDQQSKLAPVTERIETLAGVMARTMAVRREQGFDAARQIVLAGQSRDIMAQVHASLRQMDDAERELLRDRSAKREQTYRWAVVTGLLSGVAAVAGVVAFVALLRRHMIARAAAAATIAEQGERLRTTLASIGDGVIATDAAARITTMNAVAESLTGWSSKEAAGQPLDAVFKIVNQETRRPVASPAARALKEGVVVGLANHTILIAKSGTECPIDDSAAPIRCNKGEIVGCVLVFRDVTQRRRAEAQTADRLAAASLLAAIVESSDDAIISKTLDGVIRSWNVAAERMFGYTADQAVGRHISLVIPPDRLSEEDHIIASLKAGKRIQHFETVRVRSDGRPLWVSLTISPVKDDAGRITGASKIVRDITDRKRADADRHKFVTLVENSTDFIAMCDLKGVPFYVNPAGLALVGLDSMEQAHDKLVKDFFFPEDQRMIMEEFFSAVLKQGHGETEVRFRHFKTGAARWMAYKVLTLTDAAGQLVGLATVSQDVTDRRRLESDLRTLAANLSEADRRKDEFLATLAHELRNPLAPIRNALQVLRLGPDAAEHEQARAMMQRQLEQMVRLVDDLLDVSRITRGRLDLRKEQVLLSTVLTSAIETSRPVVDAMDHRLTVTLPPEPLVVDADPTRLAQVFANLLNNSAKYMDRGGHIWLTAECQGSDVTVSVRDVGIGIAAEQLPHVFEMFTQAERSLERSQGGLGIGLTLVKRLVEMHCGRIEAASEGPGRGSEFVVRLPIVVDAVGASSASDAGDRVTPKLSLRILIVDDNRDGANSIAMLLRIMGNDTRTAYDGRSGVAVAEEFRPDVILLDIGLPKMNGYEACRHIRRQPWGKSVVLIAVTGWGQEDDRRRSHEAGFDHHMVKPVDPEDLMKLLAELDTVKS